MTETPPVRSTRIALRSIVREDYDYLHALASDPAASYRWRYRGGTPSPEAFAAQLWDGVLAQFMVLSRESGRPVGAVALYNANLHSGYVYLSLIADPRIRRTGISMDAGLLLCNYAFANWNLRRVYLETTEFNLEQFGSGEGRYFHEAARLRDHEFFSDRYWDLVTLVVERDDFADYGPRLLAALGATCD